MERNVNVIKDINGNNIVIINDIRFKGKRSVKWDDVKKYLETFVGEFYEIADTKDIVYIGSDLPDEYTGSKYTYSLKGTAARAKANAAQVIPEMLEIAAGRQFKQNQEKKHQWNAKNGWYKYESRFALPVSAENGEVERYNVFHSSMLIRHANDGRLYLYDVLEIKKKQATLWNPKILLGKNPSLSNLYFRCSVRCCQTQIFSVQILCYYSRVRNAHWLRVP